MWQAPLFRGMLTRPEAFLEQPGVSWLRTFAQNHLKKALCHTRLVVGMYEKYQFPPSSWTWQFRTDTCTCCINTYFVYMFCLFNTLVPPFSSSASSFWPFTGHNCWEKTQKGKPIRLDWDGNTRTSILELRVDFRAVANFRFSVLVKFLFYQRNWPSEYKVWELGTSAI